MLPMTSILSAPIGFFFLEVIPSAKNQQSSNFTMSYSPVPKWVFSTIIPLINLLPVLVFESGELHEMVVRIVEFVFKTIVAMDVVYPIGNHHANRYSPV